MIHGVVLSSVGSGLADWTLPCADNESVIREQAMRENREKERMPGLRLEEGGSLEPSWVPKQLGEVGCGSCVRRQLRVSIHLIYLH